MRSSPQGVVIRVRLRYPSADEFVARFGAYLSSAGVFLPTRDPRPVGTRVRFELLLASGERVLCGTGVVQRLSARGMLIQFISLDAPSQALVERVTARTLDTRAFGVVPSVPPTLTPTPTPLPLRDCPPQAHAGVLMPPEAREAGPGGVRIDIGIPSQPQPVKNPSRAIMGIDLGTTNSCAAVVRNGRPHVIPTRLGRNTVPSIVALNARRQLLVGELARAQLLSNPKDTIHGAKRLIGRPFDSPAVQELREVFAYSVVEGEDGLAAVEIAGNRFSLEEVSALILREVRAVAQEHLGEEVNRAVITVPAYYNERQRDAVRRAGALSGLQVERILNEPTAAAIAYANGRLLRQRVLVYDLGGGTFDVSILEVHDNIYEVISTGGDTFLGGVDFDNCVVARLLEIYERAVGEPFDGDAVAFSRLVDAAERSKRELSSRQEVRIQLPYLRMRHGRPTALDATITRAELSELVKPLVEQSLEVVRDVLAAKGLRPSDIDEVVMVGGQSRMPLVHDEVRTFFGESHLRVVHPDEAVAVGAALVAQTLNAVDGVGLVDVLPTPVGVLRGDGSVRRTRTARAACAGGARSGRCRVD